MLTEWATGAADNIGVNREVGGQRDITTMAPQSTTTSIMVLKEGALRRDNNNRASDKTEMRTRMGMGMERNGEGTLAMWTLTMTTTGTGWTET